MSAQSSKIATYSLNNATLTITADMNLRTIIIYPHASVDGSMLGTGSFGSTASTSVPITAGGPPIIIDDSQREIDGLAITAGATCTLTIIGIKNALY